MSPLDPRIRDASPPHVGPLLASLCAGLSLIQVATYAAPPELWKGVHWLVGYDMGWLKRGLPGTLLAALAPHAVGRIEFVALFGLLALVLVLASFSLWAVLCYRARPTPFTAVLIASAYLSPLLVSFWAEDVGRFDQLLYGLLLPLLLVLRKPSVLSIAPVVLFSAFAVLVHEAYLLLELPLLLACWLEAQRRAEVPAPRAFAGMALVGLLAYATSALLSGGGMARMPRTVFLATLELKSSFAIDHRAIFMYYNDLFDTIGFTLGEKFGSPLHGIWELAKSGLTIGVWAALPLLGCHRYARSTGLMAPSARLHRLALVALLLVPFTLFPIGIDWGRWASCIVMNLYVFCFFVTVLGDPRDAAAWPAPIRNALEKVNRAGLGRPLLLAAFLLPLTWGTRGPTVGTPFDFESGFGALVVQAWQGLRLLVTGALP